MSGEVVLTGLAEDTGPGDIVGAVAGETELDPDRLGNISLNSGWAMVESEKPGELSGQLDGAEINEEVVEARKIDEEDKERIRRRSDYVERYMELVELEREEEMRQHEEEIRNLSGREREGKGRAILHLRGREEGEAIEGKLVKFMRNRKGEELPETEIGVGDLVMISKKDPLREDNPTGTVVEKTNYSITVAFDDTPGFIFSRGLRMDLYVNDITYQRMKEALQEILNPGKAGRIEEIVTGNEKPGEGLEKEIENWENPVLNSSQKEAVKSALESDDLYLIHGPPGTGKTTTAIEIIEQLVDREESVLATADSNIAVDNILEFLLDRNVEAVRVGHPARVTPRLREHTLDALVQHKEKWQKAEKLREKAFELKDQQEDLTPPSGRYRRGMSDSQIRKKAEKGIGSRGVPPEKIQEMADWLELQEDIDRLFEKSDRLRDEAVEEIIENADVVCSTNSTSGSDLLKNTEFDTVVIDEATQSTEPSCLIPIIQGEKVVMAGDHRQLPPTVKSQEASKKGLEETLFERLAEEYPWKKSMLKKQYRMNRQIMEFSSRQFYSGELEADESVESHTLMDLEYDPETEKRGKAVDPETPAVFLDTANVEAEERTPPGSTSKENPEEAEIATKVTERLLESGLREEQVAVISPYDDQVDLLQRKLDRENLEVKTVDGFQGREKEAVVISLTRSNDRGEIGFLDDVRRLNVSLTRAKRKLVVIGDSSTVKENETYSRLIEHVKKNDGYVKISR